MLGVMSPVVADAQRVITGNDRGIAAESVDAHRSQSLKVRKVAENPNDDVPEGQLPPGGVEGIAFKLFRVNGIDVTTTDGRETAKRMVIDDARSRGLTLVDERRTDGDGEVMFTGLEPGLYLLEEIEPDDPSYEWRTSRPQLVILPLGDVTGTGFTYDNVIVTKPGGNLTPPPTTPGEPPSTSTPGVPPETTVPENPPGTTTPGQPPEAQTPPPGTTDVPENPDRTREPRFPFLAETGANVLWFVGIAFILMAVGVFLARRKNDGSTTK